MGNRPIYKEAAQAMGEAIARRGLSVVYGGGNVGLMGMVADAALAAGGEVIGVIPRFLVDKEISHNGLTQLHVVNSIHDRKALSFLFDDTYLKLLPKFVRYKCSK